LGGGGGWGREGSLSSRFFKFQNPLVLVLINLFKFKNFWAWFKNEVSFHVHSHGVHFNIKILCYLHQNKNIVWKTLFEGTSFFSCLLPIFLTCIYFNHLKFNYGFFIQMLIPYFYFYFFDLVLEVVRNGVEDPSIHFLHVDYQFIYKLHYFTY